MVGRTRGYHYRRRADGTKYRVYSGAARKATGRKPKGYTHGRRGSSASYPMDVVMGYGGYRKRGGGKFVTGSSPPEIRNSKGAFIVRHREYIADVASNILFTLGQFPLNPGIATTFPWLSQVAQQFEEWVPRGIIFEFKSLCSDAIVTGTNGSLGSIVFATEYNPLNSVFGSKQEMENYEWATSCKPSVNMIHQVECKKSQNPLPSYFVRNAAVPATADARFYDLGTFCAASVGMQSAGNAIGELWISYEIEFRKPRMNTDLDVVFDHIPITTATTGVTPVRWTGTGGTFPVISTTSTLGGIASQLNPGRYIFPNGNPGLFGARSQTVAIGDVFFVWYAQRYSVAGTDGVTTFTGVGCNITAITPFIGNTVGSVQPVDAVTATETTVMYCACVQITAVDPTSSGATASPSFSLSNTSTANTATVGGDLFVISMPNNLN